MPGHENTVSVTSAPPSRSGNLQPEQRDRGAPARRGARARTGRGARTLGARGPHEVLVQHFEHGGARVAAPLRDEHEREHGGRQDECPSASAKPVVAAERARCRRPGTSRVRRRTRRWPRARTRRSAATRPPSPRSWRDSRTPNSAAPRRECRPRPRSPSRAQARAHEQQRRRDRSSTRPDTGRPPKKLKPQLPERNPPAHLRYWT